MKGTTKIHASSEKESIMRNNKLLKIGSFLLLLLLIFSMGLLSTGAANSAKSPTEVFVGGMPFGVKFNTQGVLVVGFCDVEVSDTAGASRKVNPARDGGLQIKDVITAVDGKPLTSADDLTQAVEESRGNPMTFTIKRRDASSSAKRNLKQTAEQSNTETLTVKITPAYCKNENRYKTGLWIRDSGAGIGTVTFVLPGSNAFAGLGHGICDGDTGELIPMQRGQVMDVTISGIKKGLSGDPGAIKGYFAPGKTGTLLGNTSCGVYGVYATLPATAKRKVSICDRNQVKDGEVTILCTLDDGNMGSYKATISHIDRQATGSKCFAITITDPTLLAKTGGIVQGMSGSPILQNGKLVGAVTHVLVNDPTTGYGIFVDNMLRDMPELLK